MARSAKLPTNLSPARLDLDVYRGDSLSLRLQLLSHGAPVNIDGWVFTAHVRESPDGVLLQKFTVDQGVAVPAFGVLRLLLHGVVTDKLPVGVLVWDLQSVDPFLRVRTLLRGEFVVMADVTHVERVVGSGFGG